MKRLMSKRGSLLRFFMLVENRALSMLLLTVPTRLLMWSQARRHRTSWTVKFDADGKVLKRHEREDGGDHRDPNRVGCTHKQPDKRVDLELTDDTISKRVQLFDTPSSRHELVPNLHDSSGETEYPETRGSAMKKSRVDADMEISAVEALPKRQDVRRSSTGHCK